MDAKLHSVCMYTTSQNEYVTYSTQKHFVRLKFLGHEGQRLDYVFWGVKTRGAIFGGIFISFSWVIQNK